MWHDSYVAEQHLHHYGKSSAPVCWSLVGYASGYTSACLDRRSISRNRSASPRAQPGARSSARTPRAGAIELEALRDDFHGGSLGREVERLRDMVHRRLQDVDRRERLVATRERELNLLRERVARHAASKHFIAEAAPCRTCSSSRRGSRRWTRPSWSTARAAPARSSSCG